MNGDPETLWGPLLVAFTRHAAARERQPPPRSSDALLVSLAAHAGVAPILRLVAVALADGVEDMGRRTGT